MTRYRLLYRPPSFATLPKAAWTLVERPNPRHGFERRADLPVSVHEFGVVEFDRALTADEIAAFELEAVPAPGDPRVLKSNFQVVRFCCIAATAMFQVQQHDGQLNGGWVDVVRTDLAPLEDDPEIPALFYTIAEASAFIAALVGIGASLGVEQDEDLSCRVLDLVGATAADFRIVQNGEVVR